MVSTLQVPASKARYQLLFELGVQNMHRDAYKTYMYLFKSKKNLSFRT